MTRIDSVGCRKNIHMNDIYTKNIIDLFEQCLFLGAGSRINNRKIIGNIVWGLETYLLIRFKFHSPILTIVQSVTTNNLSIIDRMSFCLSLNYLKTRTTINTKHFLIFKHFKLLVRVLINNVNIILNCILTFCSSDEQNRIFIFFISKKKNKLKISSKI